MTLTAWMRRMGAPMIFALVLCVGCGGDDDDGDDRDNQGNDNHLTDAGRDRIVGPDAGATRDPVGPIETCEDACGFVGACLVELCTGFVAGSEREAAAECYDRCVTPMLPIILQPSADAPTCVDTVAGARQRSPEKDEQCDADPGGG